MRGVKREVEGREGRREGMDERRGEGRNEGEDAELLSDIHQVQQQGDHPGCACSCPVWSEGSMTWN